MSYKLRQQYARLVVMLFALVLGWTLPDSGGRALMCFMSTGIAWWSIVVGVQEIRRLNSRRRELDAEIAQIDRDLETLHLLQEFIDRTNGRS